MNHTTCPQCNKQVNESSNRLIQDSCGHKKCRSCLLQEEAGCKICNENSALSNNSNTLKIYSNTSVIKCDSKSVSQIDFRVAHNETTIENQFEIENIEGCEIHNKILHILIVSRSPTIYKCTICCKSFSTNASVKYHSYCGGIEKPLKCEICNKGFISKSHLETHKLKHSGVRPFSCSNCQKTFTQRSKLNRHLKLHTGERPFVCSECGKNFTNKDALTGHLRLHTGEQPYKCKQCGTRFNNKSNLTKHLATHTREKCYMCEECGKKFGNKWALVSHRKCHNSEKPHTCQKCSKSFLKIKDLKRHNLSHLAIKPFSCKLCHIRFCRKDNLERHLKNTHSIKDINEIKSATTKSTIIKVKKVETIPTSVKVSEPTIKSTQNSEEFQENPNAIHVIKMSNNYSITSSAHSNPVDLIPTIRNAVPVINGPFKLAFKTDAFKNNYNIFKREYIDEPPPRIQSMKPYDLKESLNICQKILSPMNTTPLNTQSDKQIENNLSTNQKNVIMSVGKVNEKDSLEICKKILTPPDSTPLHYETSFEHKKHAVIKNIKFKLPSTYTNNALKSNYCNIPETEGEINSDSKQYTELQPVQLNYEEIPESTTRARTTQSVIVNNLSSVDNQKDVPFSEIHWRRRTAQNFQPKFNNST